MQYVYPVLGLIAFFAVAIGLKAAVSFRCAQTERAEKALEATARKAGCFKTLDERLEAIQLMYGAPEAEVSAKKLQIRELSETDARTSVQTFEKVWQWKKRQADAEAAAARQQQFPQSSGRRPRRRR